MTSQWTKSVIKKQVDDMDSKVSACQVKETNPKLLVEVSVYCTKVTIPRYRLLQL